MLSLNMKKIKIKGNPSNKLRQRGSTNPHAANSVSSARPRGVKIVKGKKAMTSVTEEEEEEDIDNGSEINEAEEAGSESGDKEDEHSSEVEQTEVEEEEDENDDDDKKEMKKRRIKDIQHTIVSGIRSRLYESRYSFYYLIVCILAVFYIYKSLLHRWQVYSESIDKQYFDDDVKLDYAMRLLQAEQELIKELLDYDENGNVGEETVMKSRNPKLIETYRNGFIEIVKNEVKEKATAQIRGIIDGLIASKACESSTIQKFRSKILQVVETMWNNIDKKSKSYAKTHAKVVMDNNKAILEKHKEIKDFITNGKNQESRIVIESKQQDEQEETKDEESNESNAEEDNSATKNEGDDYAQESEKEDDS